MSAEYNVLKTAYEYVTDKIPFTPEIGIVLGSGLGRYVEKHNVVSHISYIDIPGFPHSTVEGHTGRYTFAIINGKKVVCMQGRVHMYEGYKSVEVVRPIRLMGMIGIKDIILSNAAGGITDGFKEGDLMLITDQVDLFVPSPLIGENIEEFGERFPDMTYLYDERIQDVIRKAAKEANIDLKEGIYCQLKGPQFESKADIQVLKKLGVGTVAMSLAVEAIAAHHMGINVGGISMIVNPAAGLSKNKISDEDIREISRQTSEKFSVLMDKVLKYI